MDKNIFNNYLSKLVDESFVFIPDWGKWEKQKENRIERLNISYREYSGNYYVEGMSSSIIFSDVEDILNEILNKYNIQQRYGDKTIRHSLHNIEGIDYSKFETKIHDDASFQVVAEEIKKIVEYGAMPFFEKYQTLEDVFRKTEKMTIEQMVNFIGQPLPQRRMVIKKLCNDPNYDEYVKWLINYYKSENDPDLFIVEKLNEFLIEAYS